MKPFIHRTYVYQKAECQAKHPLTLIALALMFILPYLSAGAQSLARSSALEEIQKGDNFMSLLLWPEALQAYDNAVAYDPSFATAHMKKADLLAKLGRTTEAEKVYAQAIKLNPQAAYIYDGRAKLRMLSNDYRGALTDLNTAVGMDRESAEIRDRLVDDLIALEMYEQALLEIDSLVASDFRVGYELEKKALVQLLEGDFAECTATLNTILLLNPRSAFAHDMRGLMLLKEGRVENALDEFTEAIETDPNMVIAYHNRAIAYRLMNNDDAAMADLNMALSIRQDLEKVYYSRALLKKEVGNLQGALQDYDRAIRINDEFEDALYNRAYTLKLLGDKAGALSDLHRILVDSPNSAQAWNMKGNIEVVYAQYPEAVQSYDRALLIDADYAEALYNRGLAKLMYNRVREGCLDLQTSLNLGFARSETKLTAFCDR